jgi:SAM-dependent methyltransferase
MDRSGEILKHARKDQKGIAIGPWFAPLAPKRDGYNCLSFDVLDTESLRRHAEQDPNTDNARIEFIEPVDVVDTATEIYRAIASRNELGTFNYILSSHNFEHLPNPIKFLQGCEQCLKEGGYLSMAIPDKRTCFDYFSPITTLGVWLEAFLQDRSRPTPIQLFEHISLFSLYEDTRGGFSLEDDARLSVAQRNLDGAYQQLLKLHRESNNDYYDVHCSKFTPSSFKNLLYDLQFLGLTRLSVEEVTPPYGFEFFVHLRNSVSDPRMDRDSFYVRRQTLLQAIISECAENAPGLHGSQRKLVTENEQLKKEVERLEAERKYDSEQLSRIKNTFTWKAASPFWRLETHGNRVAARRK